MDPDGRKEKPALYPTAGNAVNLDFGIDYSSMAVENFKNGHPFIGAIQLLDSTCELVYDLFACHFAAAVIGAATVGATAEGSIWTLDKFARGWEAEQRLGGMMNNFPVIDKYDKVKNFISSIKSMDLTCNTYKYAANITRTINGYADKLANFVSGKSGAYQFTANSSTQRCLELAIPKGVATPEQLQAIQKSVDYAKSIGVDLIIHEIQ